MTSRPTDWTTRPHPPEEAREEPRVPPWSQRIPELVAGIGSLLLALAAIGGVIHSWDWLSQLQRGVLLLAVGVGLTVAGLWLDDRVRDPRARHTITLAWAGATALVIAAVDLMAGATGILMAGATGIVERGVVAVSGAAGAAHAGALLAWRRPRAMLQHVTLFVALVYGLGPLAATSTASVDFTTGWTLERLATTTLWPLVSLLTGDIPTAAVLPNALGLAAIGAAWAVVSARASGALRYTGVAIASFALAWGALLANGADNPVGSAIALAIVLGLLVGGIAREDALLVTLGSIGTTVAGLRVLAAIFAGVELVILLTGGLGLAMVAGALWALRRRRGVGSGPGRGEG
ncbi:hypothetical protein ER308_06195 [Egibacter rhizosphaerae]|uniref:Uncharacterized protein n=1 Tax=Egibacter rhizosphaerae TaxID=1670831 RepID=A0A411YD74_9ACTN|nr:hypothetical protein [Egibacter rhizosphaerae]QBI19169.1 hypothetical protein ER308_06195 [Egibacter rhizosphaerae]